MEYYYNDYYPGQLTNIDMQIAELEARKKALLNGYCFTGYYGTTKPYLDPYGLDTGNQVKITMSLMNGEGHMLEIEGTEKQIEAFEAERKECNEALFPSAMSFEKTVGLALEHGLSIKKVTLNKEGK